MKLDVLALIPVIALHHGRTFNKKKSLCLEKKTRLNVFMLTSKRYFTRSSRVCTKQNHFVGKKIKCFGADS